LETLPDNFTKRVNSKLDTVSIENIYGLVNTTTNEYRELDRLPFQEIIKSITAYSGRRKKTS
ncbi:MAG: hypothetical protein KAR30_05385, partial [Gammaproteobacteria bacterium]|nr:hypothetical protein [Gammaproteobacteria bacterium]